MKALVIAGGGSMTLQDVPQPGGTGECRIRVRMAGICGTDLQLLEGYADFRGIPGHEFVGIVEAAASPVDAAWVGRRVVGEINIGCGRCEWCAAGIKEHCVGRTVVGIRGRGGAFADLLCLPAGNLHAVPDAMDDETAVFVEPTAAACRILEQVAVDDRARVAVIGDGRLGLLVAQVLRTAAPDVTVLGRHDHKLDIARALGLAAVRTDSLTPRAARFDVVVDATGRPEGIRRALELVRPRGTVVMKSTFHGEAAIVAWPVVVDEVTLVGSRCGPFHRAIGLLASGAVRVRPLISRVTALHDYESAFADARRGLKVLFDLRSDGLD
ncbi:MAG: alcohol dehydrogenase catalytic domain-containing protein [Acidobacteria bacterium]|nr:alcohol dehydrogenase catalytic domain-containing protein [Acidobacteriota bacterium]